MELIREQSQPIPARRPAAWARAEVYADADRRMRRGKRLVVVGFGVAVLGVVGYCVACLGAAEVDGPLAASFGAARTWTVGATLAIIGLGTLLWLLGSLDYLAGAMNSDPRGPDPTF